MRKTIFILMFMCAGLVSAQIGSNPSNFSNGIALPNATNEGDTISLATKIPIMDNSGKINYFANLSALDGMFGAEWGGITGTLSDQTDLQDALDSKQATITGAASTIVTSDLTNNRALVSNGSGKVAVSAVTSTELSYVSGVTSALQTQLDAKLNSSTYTSDWSGLNSNNFLRSDENTTFTGDTLFIDSNKNIQLGGSSQLRGGLTSGTRLDLLEDNFYIRDGFSTRFTFARTTGNFTATGAGEFGGTVSGDDPVNADDFVPLGYAESNFATVESGTFAPTLVDAGGGATYSGTLTGNYTKIGNLVYVSVHAQSVNTSGSPSGAFEIRSLPFPVLGFNAGSITSVIGSSVTFYGLFPRISSTGGNDKITFSRTNSLAGTMTGFSSVTFTSGQFTVSGSYIADE